MKTKTNLQFTNVSVFWRPSKTTGATGLMLPDLSVVLGGDGDALDWIAITDINVKHTGITQSRLFQLIVQIIDNIT